MSQLGDRICYAALGQAEIVTYGTEKPAPRWLQELQREGRGKEQSKHAKVGSINESKHTHCMICAIVGACISSSVAFKHGISNRHTVSSGLCRASTFIVVHINETNPFVCFGCRWRSLARSVVIRR